MIRISIALFAILAMLFTSCRDDDDDMPTVKKGKLELNLEGLEPLGDNAVYEGWVIVDGKPVSTGTFRSVQFPQTFTLDQNVIDKATKFVLSIEPADDNDPAPSMTKLLIGDFSGNMATVSSKPILGEDFGGKFVLATPTDGSNNNELSGVWFTGLELPDLPEGWKYEGWVMMNGKPLTTGTFSDPKKADDNAVTSIYKGTVNNGPNLPGEDYIMGSFNGVTFPTDLSGGKVILSIEPYPDNSTNPFTIKPILADIPSDIKDHTAISFKTGPVMELMGTVKRK